MAGDRNQGHISVNARPKKGDGLYLLLPWKPAVGFAAALVCSSVCYSAKKNNQSMYVAIFSSKNGPNQSKLYIFAQNTERLSPLPLVVNIVQCLREVDVHIVVSIGLWHRLQHLPMAWL